MNSDGHAHHPRQVPVAAVMRRPSSWDPPASAWAVVGAGVHGLASLKALQQLGTPAVGYESAMAVGGSWHEPREDYPWEESVTAARISSFPDFPLSDRLATTMTAREALQYLDRYADHFGLADQVRFGHEVIDIEEVDDEDLLAVTSRDAQTAEITTDYFSGVVLATGHSRYGDTLDYPGMSQFRKPVVRADEFRPGGPSRVLVIGAAGGTIAATVAALGGTAWLATATAGQSPGESGSLLGILPQSVRRVMSSGANLLPWVTEKSEEPTMPGASGHGVALRPAVERFTEHSVWFEDGSRVDPDIVVVAAGYLAGFSYVDDELLNVEGGQPRLGRNIFTPRHPGLLVSGWLPTGSGDCALAHWQAMLIARYARKLRAEPRKALSFHREVCRGLDEPLAEPQSRRALLRAFAADRDRLES